MLEVLHRVHSSALLMMDTCRELWGVSSEKRISLVAHEACRLNR